MAWDANLDFPTLPAAPTYEIRQSYLVNTPEASVRVRLESRCDQLDTSWQSRSRAVICLKKATGSMMIRSEDEYGMDWETAYDIMEPLRREHVITKSRYYIDGYDIDFFHGPLEGLIIIEREFSSVEEANAFEVPIWIGREVTNDPAYINANLIGKKYENGELYEYNSLLRH